MNKVLKEISKIGIVPVIAIENANDAVAIAKALCDGGVSCAEITFRTDAAEESIRLITKALPEMLVGAGTVLTIKQVDQAVEAGAKFIVSPGLNPKVVQYCVNNQIPVTPGCANPSDIEVAIELGLEVVKFFPAEASGGLPMIKAMSAPYGNMKFMPTGGVNINNLTSYFEFEKIFACGGSWMVKKEDVKNKNFENITKLTKEAVDKMLGFSIKQIGINAENTNDANDITDAFSRIFPTNKKEVMKEENPRKNGHLAVETNSMERAIYYLVKQGIEVNLDAAKTDKNGNVIETYLKGEIGGFAVQLLQNK